MDCRKKLVESSFLYACSVAIHCNDATIEHQFEKVSEYFTGGLDFVQICSANRMKSRCRCVRGKRSPQDQKHDI